MTVDRSGRIKLSANGSNSICPSVSHLFGSVCEVYGKNSLAMLLTGMGSDGARELKQLRDAGAFTIAQDKESSLVYGMPQKAVELNAAAYLLNPAEISKLLQEIEANSESE